MARKNRKIMKKRGSRRCGHGHHRTHRGKGQRGGKGMAGICKSRWTWAIKYSPHHFGTYGFKLPPEVKSEYSSINLYEIEEKLESFVNSGVAVKKGELYEVDLSKAGYKKVLGGGRISIPMKIKAELFSEKAKEKIASAGGEAVTLEA
jgi:large subunit ribosomal protein L15